jgi:hypothetical protein
MDTVKEGLADKQELGRVESQQKTNDTLQRPQPETKSVKTADRPGAWKTKE